MIKSPHRFIVEIDEDFYSTHNEKGEKLSVFMPQEGTKFQRLPKHGILVNTVDENIPEGTTVYYHHFCIGELFSYEGKKYVPVNPHELISYEDENGEMIGYSRIVAKRFFTDAHIKNEEAIIKLPDVPKYESHKFEILHNPTKCPVEKGDVVWIYTNTDYIIEHKLEYSFLEPEKIVYNQTKDEMLEPWVLVESYDKKDGFEDAVKVGSIYMPLNATKQKNEVVVVKGMYGLKKGDEIYIKRSSSNKIPLFPDANIIDYRNVLLCLN